MNTPIKSKIRTIVVNSELGESQKKTLEAFFNEKSEGELIQLVTAFEKHPNGVTMYSEFLEKISSQGESVTLENLEKELSILLERVS